MPENKVTLDDDDFVAVFLGKDQSAPSDFAQNPRIQWIDAVTGIPTQEVIKNISPKAKLFILTEGIPHAIYHEITAQARKTKALYLHRKNQRAVLGTLYEVFPRATRPATENGHGQAHGRIQQLLRDFPPDLAKSGAEEARRLFEIAKSKGIITTHGSIAQAISTQKRKAGRGDIPASARVKNPKADGLQAIDDAIASLQLLREWIESSSKELDELRATVTGLRKVLGV